LADAITSADAFACDAGGLLYLYRTGVYLPDADRHIKQEVKRLLVAWDKTFRWSSRLAEEVAVYISADAPMLWERPPLSPINLTNGLLDVHTGTLYPHTPSYLSTIQLPIQYDPTADCPAWDRFLATVLPLDVYTTRIIWQLLALLMIPATDAHQAVLLSGPGGNGKGALLAAVRSFLGKRNVSSLNLDQITSEQFLAVQLFGKLANICDDLSSRHLGDSSAFKRIVGGDPLMTDRKHREPITFQPFARLLFSANEYPQSADASSGFYDRWVVIPFTEEFRGQQGETPRHILDAQLAAPQELSGVLNQALAALPGILGRRLPMPLSMRTAWDEISYFGRLGHDLLREDAC
jgi:putative DNA primase/helicase